MTTAKLASMEAYKLYGAIYKVVYVGSDMTKIIVSQVFVT